MNKICKNCVTLLRPHPVCSVIIHQVRMKFWTFCSFFFYHSNQGSNANRMQGVPGSE